MKTYSFTIFLILCLQIFVVKALPLVKDQLIQEKPKKMKCKCQEVAESNQEVESRALDAELLEINETVNQQQDPLDLLKVAKGGKSEPHEDTLDSINDGVDNLKDELSALFNMLTSKSQQHEDSPPIQVENKSDEPKLLDVNLTPLLNILSGDINQDDEENKLLDVDLSGLLNTLNLFGR